MAEMPNDLSKYTYSTAPIFKKDSEGKPYDEPVGTGFVVHKLDEKSEHFFVTCKHIFYSDDSMWDQFPNNIKGEFVAAFHGVKDGRATNAIVLWHLAPNEAKIQDGVDLACFPMSDVPRCGVVSVPREIFPTKPVIDTLGVLNEVYLIGYPNGLWDNFNNLPLVRSGRLALPASTRWRNDDMGIFNLSCYPGDSGAPVFARTNQGQYFFLGVHADGVEAETRSNENMALGHYVWASLLVSILDQK